MKSKLHSLLPQKWKLAAVLSLSFAVPFMVFIHSTLDIYLHNPLAFVVSWRFFLPPLLVIFFICFISMFFMLLVICQRKAIFGIALLALFGLFIIFARFILNLLPDIYIYLIFAVIIAIIIWILITKKLKDKASDAVLLSIWGVFVSAYIQVLLLNGRMTVITGAEPTYSALSLGNIINLVTWIVIALLPLSLWIILRVKKIEFKYEKGLVLSVLIIIGMQITGLVSTTVSTDLPKGYDRDDSPRYVSYEAALSLSAEDNIIVFVVDKLDVMLFREALERYPHIRDVLDGFTLFENNTAEFFDTLPTMVSLLTQHYYREGLTVEQYWDEAWSRHNMLDILQEHGFTTNLYIDYLSTYGNHTDIEARTDNLRYFHNMSVDIRGLLSTTTRLSFSRLSPYFLKNIFLAPITTAFGNQFFTIDIDDPLAAQPPIVSHASDMQFLQYISQNEFSADNSQRVFTLMHLDGAHWGNENIAGINYSFMAISAYFDAMKEIGVYDNSTIMIFGDHGVQHASDYNSGWRTPVTTALLIKPRDSTGALETDTQTELSLKYFAASVLELANIPHDEFGVSFFDIIDERVPPPPVRIKYGLASWWESWWAEDEDLRTIPLHGIYEIRGDANNGDNWTFIPSD